MCRRSHFLKRHDKQITKGQTSSSSFNLEIKSSSKFLKSGPLGFQERFIQGKIDCYVAMLAFIIFVQLYQKISEI